MELMSDNFEDDFIDFDNLDIKSEKNYPKSITYEVDFDHTTTSIYKNYRELKIDPISGENIDDLNSFKVPYMWDSITGEKLDKKDPFGSLYFNPIFLLKYFYNKRLNYLWNDELDEGNNGGFFEGYYDIGIGSGENFDVVSRGSFPEYYLWRLPVIDCYLQKDHKKSIPTKGPKLSKKEIEEIYKLCLKMDKKNWITEFKTIPNLVIIYELYHLAISKIPLEEFSLDFIKKNIDLSEDDTNENINKKAVEKLKLL